MSEVSSSVFAHGPTMNFEELVHPFLALQIC